MNVWTRYLDPADPFLAADEQGLGQGLLVRFDYPRRPYEAGADAAGFDLYTVHGPRDLALDWYDPATWGAPAASVPHQARVAGTVTSVTVLASGDPATRRVRVVTDIDGGATEGGGTGSNGATWVAAPGTCTCPPRATAAGAQEYQVEVIEPGASATFTLAWPVALGLPDPVRGPCTWYPGYQVFLPGYRVPLGGAASVAGAAALGAADTAGNLGRVSAATAFQRVDHAPPAQPGAFALGVQELLASTPDAYGRSRFTLAWEPAADGARHLVYRALDAAVLARHGLTVDEGRAMDAATLKRLADDPLAEAAFSQLTPEPLDATTLHRRDPGGLRLEPLPVPAAHRQPGRHLRRPGRVQPAGGGARRRPAAPADRDQGARRRRDRHPDIQPEHRARCRPLRRLPRRGCGRCGGHALDDPGRYRGARRGGDHDRVRRRRRRRPAAHAGGRPPLPGHRRGPGGQRVQAVPRGGRQVLLDRAAARAAAHREPRGRRRQGQGGLAGTAGRRERAGAAPGRRQGAAWQSVSTWLVGVRGFEDTGLDPAAAYGYRLKAMSPWRTVAESDPIEVPPA